MLIACFIFFVLCMAGALLLKLSMLLPLAVGFVLFAGCAVRKGIAVPQVLRMAAGSFRDSFVVIGVLLLIGCLTGLWRISGTIAYFVSLGVSLIPPKLFLLAAFLLSSAMSFALGTSFGVTATAGVILMSIGLAGGVNPVLAAGAILSGVYVGDRGSPAASSATLTAVVTGTELRDNIRDMLRTGALPFLLCCAAYALLSVFFPCRDADSAVLRALEEEFRPGWYCLIPAILMLLLPFLKVKVKLAMAVSIVASFAVGIFWQRASIADCLRAMILGYTARSAALEGTLDGGGIVSMLEVCGILLISGTYGSIFRGAGLLDGVYEKLRKAAGCIGRFPTTLLLSAGVCMLFCNQTIGILMLSQLTEGLYGTDPAEKRTKMLDLEDSVITVAGLVPWCIACSVPLGMLNADARSVPFAFYLWLIPVCHLLFCRKTIPNPKTS